MRFYFVDRITEIVPGKSIRGHKNVSMAEPYFATHFPRFPVLPGVILIEAMAQLAGLLIEVSPVPDDAVSTRKTTPAAAGTAAAGSVEQRKPWVQPDGPSRKAILSIVDRVKFKKLVRPGDRVDLAADLVVFAEDGARAEVSAHVDGALVAQTRLTFVLMPVPPEFETFMREERAALLAALQVAP